MTKTLDDLYRQSISNGLGIEQLQKELVTLQNTMTSIVGKMEDHFIQAAQDTTKLKQLTEKVQGHHTTLYGIKGDNGLQGSAAKLSFKVNLIWAGLGAVATAALSALAVVWTKHG